MFRVLEFRIHITGKAEKRDEILQKVNEDRVTTESPDSESFDSSQSTARLKKRSETAL